MNENRKAILENGATDLLRIAVNTAVGFTTIASLGLILKAVIWFIPDVQVLSPA